MNNLFAALAVWMVSLISAVNLPAPSSAGGNSTNQQVVQLSSDCTIKKVPDGFSRVFIGPKPINPRPIAFKSSALKPKSSSFAAHTDQGGSGTAADPYDGSTAEKFYGILRSRSQANQQNLTICIAPGTFHTEPPYSFLANL